MKIYNQMIKTAIGASSRQFSDVVLSNPSTKIKVKPHMIKKVVPVQVAPVVRVEVEANVGN